MADRLQELFRRSTPILLDGATGTELARREVEIDQPLWATVAIESAPDVLGQIHADYVAAGAEIITANTFRCHRRNLAAIGRQSDWERLLASAVRIARDAGHSDTLVAGSLAPLEDCYRPDLVPDRSALIAEHRIMARGLVDAGVDLILIETHNTVAEVAAASEAAAATGGQFFASVVCGPDGRMLSGEPVYEAIDAVRPYQPSACLVNCLPASAVDRTLKELQQASDEIPIGVYANVGVGDSAGQWQSTSAENPAVYADAAETWVTVGARLIGGCCGTTPEHIRTLRERFQASI